MHLSYQSHFLKNLMPHLWTFLHCTTKFANGLKEQPSHGSRIKTQHFYVKLVTRILQMLMALDWISLTSKRVVSLSLSCLIFTILYWVTFLLCLGIFEMGLYQNSLCLLWHGISSRTRTLDFRCPNQKTCYMSFRLMTLLFKTNAALLRVSLNQKILPQVGQQSKHTTISSNVTHLLIWIGPDKKKATQTLTSV